MGIYLSSGYLDINKILSYGMPFNFVVGGRGTGKTYGAIKHSIDNNILTILMRRTQKQADLISKQEFSPLKPICDDLGIQFEHKSISKDNCAIMLNKPTVDESLVWGYTCALSTISNMRGFDASAVELLIYDEFIPEKHERPLRHEGTAFFNAYETINRNRELKGKKPLQVLALANANDIGNPIFLECGLVMISEKMRQKNQEVYLDKERGIGLFLLQRSPISHKKAETALYKLSGGSEYSSMALNNDFVEAAENIKSMPIVEFKPVVTIGELTVYKHKSMKQYYVSSHRSGSPITFTSSENDRERFARGYNWLWDVFMNGSMYFETYLCQLLLTEYLK